MNEQEIAELIRVRLQHLDDARRELTVLAESVESTLYDLLTQNYDDFVKNLSRFYAAYSVFVQKEWLPLVSNIVATFRLIETWNADYFNAQQISRIDAIGNKVEKRLLSMYGLTPAGKAIKGGYVDALSNYPDAADSLARFLMRESVAGRKSPIVLRELGWLTKGNNGPGLMVKTMNTFVFDRMQEADRVVQTVYAEELKLTAAMYSGGTIDGSRPFCKARNGKVFLYSEIEKFGTSADAYGGYADKSRGYFSGKPTTGYNPFVQAGGYACRHSFGFVSNRTALRLRPDLIEEKGVLTIKSNNNE